MALIVCIHGIGQQFEGEEKLLKEWIPALQDGVQRTGMQPPTKESIEMAFYGDLFRRKNKRSISIPPYDEYDITEEWEKEMIQLWWTEAARIDDSVRGPEERTRLRTPRVVQRALNALSHSAFFADITLKAFIADLKQVYAYLHDEHIRSNAQDRVARVVDSETQVVIGHSLGSIIAYEALAAHPEWSVKTLVTLGSPLGIRNLIFDRLLPAPENDLGIWPEGVDRWVNVVDHGDIVALVKDLASRFGPRVQDHVVFNGWRAHDVSRYLTAEQTGVAISQSLNEV
jgi:pimeloyl-ACP methyl ester carboxylesterase